MNLKHVLRFVLLSSIVYIISSHNLYGQEIIDSLSNKSQLDLETNYNNSKNASPKKAKIYAEALYTLAQKKNRKKDIAKALYKKAYIENKLGNRNSALLLIDESRTINASINNDTLLLKNANLKGIIYSLKNEYLKSIDAYLEAKTIAESMGNTRDVLVISHNIAIIKQEINDFQGALDIFLSNLERINSSNESYSRQKLLTYFTLTDTYIRLENLERAKFYNKKGLTESINTKHTDLHIFFLSNKAILKFKDGNFQDTIVIYESIHNDVDALSNTKLLIIEYLYLGKSYFELNDFDQAILNFNKIKDLSSNFKEVSQFNLQEIYYYLAKSYIKTGQTDLANENFDLLIALDKENDITTKIAERKIYKDFDLSNLKDELNTLNNELSKQKKKVYYIYGLAIFLIVLIVLFYRRKQIVNKQRFEKLVLEIEALENKKGQEKTSSIDTSITDENVYQILEKLKKFEENKVYLNTECTLSYVAKKVNTNTSYLSKVINKHKSKPFKTYLTELRINEALIQIKNNKTLRAYTIKAIASEFGFKRQETFSRAFKLRTGIYPSTYIKNLDNEKVKQQ